MAVLSQSTAYTRSFVMYLAGTRTPATGKTVTVNLTKAGGTFGVAGGAVAEIANGWYKVSLNTTDTNTLGDLGYNCTAAACDPNDFSDQVGPVPANMIQINGLATNGHNATLSLKQLDISNSSGDAITAFSTGGNGKGLNCAGNGTGNGIAALGGATAAGLGCVGGNATGTGPGIYAQSGSAGSDGIVAIAGGNGAGMTCTGMGSGAVGIQANGGTNGAGIVGQGNGNSPGIAGLGGGTGNGILCQGGATSGNGLYCIAATSGVGIYGQGANGGAGAQLNGNGSGHGLTSVGGATGHGIYGQGGTASGDGIVGFAVGSGSGLVLVGVGAPSLIATQGISGPLDASTYNAMADAALVRDWTSIVSSVNSRSTLNALRFIRNKWSISGSLLTVTKEDDSTSAWNATLVTDGTALPVVSFTGN